MDLEQYTGCLIGFNGRIAEVTGAGSNYDGDFFCLRYAGGEESFFVNAFDDELLKALPDPENGILKRKDNGTVFLYKGREYSLCSHPYEPCLYIKYGGEIFRTLHNAFESDGLCERFARGETLTGIDGRQYSLTDFCRTLAAAVICDRPETDFTFAAALSRTADERFEDYKHDIKTKPAAFGKDVFKFCPQCGKKNSGGRFCTECGTAMTRA